VRVDRQRAGRYARALLLKGGQFGLRLLDKAVGRDTINDGNWYGNDTIWRTILDLNKVLAYTDKNGVLRDRPQRAQSAAPGGCGGRAQGRRATRPAGGGQLHDPLGPRRAAGTRIDASYGE